MSSTLASSIPAPSSTDACIPLHFKNNTKGPSCVVANDDESRDVLEKCCNIAPIVVADDGCTMSCLAMGQNLKDLVDCMMESNIDYMCAGISSATAEAPSSTPTSDKTGTKTESESPYTATETDETGTKTESESPSTPTETNDASPQRNVMVSSKAGLALCFVVFPAIFANMLF